MSYCKSLQVYKAWQNRVASRPKFSTWVYLRVRLVSAFCIVVHFNCRNFEQTALAVFAYSCLDMSKSLACDGYQPVYIIGCQKLWQEQEMLDSELFIKGMMSMPIVIHARHIS